MMVHVMCHELTSMPVVLLNHPEGCAGPGAGSCNGVQHQRSSLSCRKSTISTAGGPPAPGRTVRSTTRCVPGSTGSTDQSYLVPPCRSSSIFLIELGSLWNVHDTPVDRRVTPVGRGPRGVETSVERVGSSRVSATTRHDARTRARTSEDAQTHSTDHSPRLRRIVGPTRIWIVSIVRTDGHLP